uniref:Carboxylesterase type B domain-containing protein n=1 Tax=Ditylenchus dipsaci TaxID=166011 RepID=A0A915CUD0_9BILA
MSKKKLHWKQYVFLFDYVRPFHHPLLGIDPTYTPHGYQYQYLMDTQSAFPFKKEEINEVESEFTRKIVDAIVQFVKTGDPSSEEVEWPTVDHHPSQITYLRVGEQVVAEGTHFTQWKKFGNKFMI